MLKITREKIKNFNKNAVEIVDIANKKHRGWFVIEEKEYKLYPLNDIWNTYSYKLCHIKSIKHLTNNYELRNE